MRLLLPSRARAVLDAGLARDAAQALVAGSVLARAMAVLAEPGVARFERGGSPIPLEDLPLADLQVLRVALVRLGAAEEPEIGVACDNCEAIIRVAPAAKVELGPFLDGELDDEELDAPFPFDREHSIPPIRVARAAARTIRLAPRTIGEARFLLRRDPRDPLRLVPATVAAMGITALGAERRATAIARALDRATDAAWDEVCALWEDAHGHLRLVAQVRCPSCEAVNRIPAPAERELSSSIEGVPSRRAGAGSSRAFPDADDFEQMVRRHADLIYARRRIRNVDLVVDEGVPAVDDGGEPLLGCYTPTHVDPDLQIDRPPEIRLFMRSFRAEVDADPRFDLDAEVAETIDHELEHHENFLRGHDPLDDDERAAIAVENRRIVGRKESARRGMRALGSELLGFLRVGWPFLVVGAVVAWLGTCR